MKTTFDTNTYRPVVEPERYINHPDYTSFKALHDAARAGRIQPFACEAMFTLEAVTRVDRAAYLASRRLTSEIKESETDDGRITGSITLAPDHAQHPGLSAREVERLEKALDLGFRFLSQPRIGMARPPEMRPDLHRHRFATDADISSRLQKFSDVALAIQARGVGFARAAALGERARNRAKAAVPWFSLLADERFFNADERKELAAAVGEWVDGDNVAAHIAYANDVFCTLDTAGKGRPSVFNGENRAWLSDTYCIRFATPTELASLLASAQQETSRDA